ncbi:LamB/YcsF family protein [Deinococcus ficus]|uniref:LamB/YcsF family protein n=1 Tax=Deinococcus ficus TaxID=317577 RepID=UPI0003B3BAA3|nr:5-oxoprolinase subunit PxpA [Deinococcus ficus]
MTPSDSLRRMDLNADLGEGSPHEAQVMPVVTSANVACGGHSGDEATMRASVRLAAAHGVGVGAHPGFPDREGFGRRALPCTPDEVTAFVTAQVRALQAIAAAESVTVAHVKPHGALYNLAARDGAVAAAVVRAVVACGVPVVYGLAGESALLEAARAAGLEAVGEGFADRGYAPDGTLWPRGQAGGLLDADATVAQGVEIAVRGAVRAVTGERVAVPARTLCLHGDGPEAAQVAGALRRALEAAGVRVVAPGR